MKKGLINILLLSFLLVGCAHQPTVEVPAENEFVIQLINNTDIDVYGYEVNIYQNNNLRETQGGIYADNSKVKKGSSFSTTFEKQNFLANEEMQIEVTVFTDKNGLGKVTLPAILSTNISPLKSAYFLDITGTNANNLYIK